MDLTESELLLNDSRISPHNNGNPHEPPVATPPTSGQKWWAAIVLGLVFFIISSPVAYELTSYGTTSLGGMPLTGKQGVNLAGLTLHTLLFILIVRVILW